MADFNQILTPGDYQSGTVNTVVEIPEGSILKIEWDRERAAFKLDRVEPGIFAKPCSYGFIPQTLDEDGDELDTLIVCDRLNSLEDLGERWKEMVEHHFTHYKDLKKPGSTEVQGWGDAEAAKKIIAESIERYGNR
jgi:inorganic pyrophosphatase